MTTNGSITNEQVDFNDIRLLAMDKAREEVALAQRLREKAREAARANLQAELDNLPEGPGFLEKASSGVKALFHDIRASWVDAQAALQSSVFQRYNELRQQGSENTYAGHSGELQVSQFRRDVGNVLSGADANPVQREKAGPFPRLRGGLEGAYHGVVAGLAKMDVKLLEQSTKRNERMASRLRGLADNIRNTATQLRSSVEL